MIETVVETLYSFDWVSRSKQVDHSTSLAQNEMWSTGSKASVWLCSKSSCPQTLQTLLCILPSDTQWNRTPWSLSWREWTTLGWMLTMLWKRFSRVRTLHPAYWTQVLRVWHVHFFVFCLQLLFFFSYPYTKMTNTSYGTFPFKLVS